MRIYDVGTLPTPVREIAPHAHAGWELAYYFAGTGHVIIGGELYPFAPGDLFIKPPQVDHGEKSDTGFQDIFAFCDESPAPEAGYVKLSDNEHGDLGALMRMLDRCRYRAGGQNPALMDAIGELLKQYVADMRSVGNINPFVAEMLRRMHAAIGDPDFSFADMAEKMHIHPDYAGRLFKRQMGVAPGRYMARTRMQHAAGILRGARGGVRIKDVAAMAGIRDELYFSRLFKSVMGVSPRRYLDEMEP